MYEEYLMQFQEGRLSRDYVPQYALDCEEEDQILYYYEGEELVGQMSVYIEANRINLYDVLVMPELRQKGYGKAMLYHFLTEEFPYLDEIFPIKKAPRELVLQVSSRNTPAVALYEGLGFAIIDRVSVTEDDSNYL